MKKLECPHCDPASFALKKVLQETKNFYIVCDVHPLIEGHILIIPKKHLSCIGELPEKLFQEFVRLYDKVAKFLLDNYGLVSSFEHGKIGQTVFHAHMHFLPYDGRPENIIPENKFRAIQKLSDPRTIFAQNKEYLFFSIGKNLWVVEPTVVSPGFFRQRFAQALKRAERGDWRKWRYHKIISRQANIEIKNLADHWKAANMHTSDVEL
jgi:diadenosine tetraphosphate (Ap4A) HIT family hydrolase